MTDRPAPVEHLPATEPWLRLPRETSLAYQHFVKYREMDPIVRSCRRLAEEVGRKSPEQLFTWSRQWRWVERVRAWDDYCEEQGRIAQIEKIKAAGEIRADVVLQGLRALHDRLVGRTDVNVETGEIMVQVRPINPESLDAKDISALGNMLDKMQRSAEEAAGVRTQEPTKVDVRLAFDLEGGGPVGHRVVEAAHRKELGQGGDQPMLEDGTAETVD